MKQHWIEYSKDQPECPMTYWVHMGPGGEHFRGREDLEPPMPTSVPGLGFPTLHVEYDGFTFQFASLAEIEVCIETLSMKNLPTSSQLSRLRGSGAGPNTHWISRLPKSIMPWKFRAGATTYLRLAKTDFEHELAAS